MHDAEALVRSLRSRWIPRADRPRPSRPTPFTTSASGDLRRAGEVLRLRVYGDRWKLTHKSRGTAGKHKTRVEHETAVANGEEMHAILTALGFSPSFRYEKYRAEWSDGAAKSSSTTPPSAISPRSKARPNGSTASQKLLGISEGDYITASYAELFLQWKQRTGSPALNMTFEECGTPRP